MGPALVLRSNGLTGRHVQYVVSGKLQVQGDTCKWYSLKSLVTQWKGPKVKGKASDIQRGSLQDVGRETKSSLRFDYESEVGLIYYWGLSLKLSLD